MILAHGGLIGFFVLEAKFRRPGHASSLRGPDDDRNTTRTIVFSYVLSGGLPWMTQRLPAPQMPPAFAPTGLAMQAAGLALRGWSMRALGSSYTRTLRVDHGGQELVDGGPYQWVRHPGYLGSLMTWTGFALASDNLPSAVLIPGLLGFTYHRRIVAEEELLRRDLSGYPAYCQRTKRLIPFVW